MSGLRRRVQIMLTILAVALLVGGTAARPFLGTVREMRTALPATTPFMERGRRRPVRVTAPLVEIAPALQEAVVIAEDPRFFEHHGVDLPLALFSLAANLRAGRVVRGGSTITMQLAKNLFLSPERSLWRKAQEVLIALTMEALLPKERILELYLNIAEWGPRVYGAETAARYHFGKSASELTDSEAAVLASLLPNPKLATSRIYRRRFAIAAWRIHRRLLVRNTLPPAISDH